jgi:hypothetical protein
MEKQHLAVWGGPCSTQRQARELVSGPNLATGARLLSFNRTQSRVVIGLLTGHNTLRRHLHVMGLCDSPICRKCGTGEESSVYILYECKALASLRHTYLGSFFLDPEDIRVLGVGPSGTLLKEQGSFNQVQNMGHRGPVLRPRWVGSGGAWTPFLFYSILGKYVFTLNSYTIQPMCTHIQAVHFLHDSSFILCQHCQCVAVECEPFTYWTVIKLLLITTLLAADVNLCVLWSLRVHVMLTAVRWHLNRSHVFMVKPLVLVLQAVLLNK